MLPQYNTPIDNDDVNEANIAEIIDEFLSHKNLEHNNVDITTNTYPNEVAQKIDGKIQIGLQLSKMGQTNQPDANFIDNLELKLMQAHPYNTAAKITENQSSIKLCHKPVTIAATILLCLGGAIAIPYFYSGKLNLSISDLLKPITGQKAAVTLAQLGQEYGLTVTSDAQQYDAIEDTLVAIGNVTLNNPKSKFKAQADKIEWVKNTHEFILTGNVKIFQQGKIIKGEKFSCFILEDKCIPHKTESN